MLRNVLLVGMGGMLGALVRYGVVHLSEQGFQSQGALYAILLVNLVGSFVLGVLVGAGARPEWNMLLGVGFCDGLTTFSSWMLDLATLRQTQGWAATATWMAVSVALGMGALLAGLYLGKRL